MLTAIKYLKISKKESVFIEVTCSINRNITRIFAKTLIGAGCGNEKSSTNLEIP